MEVGVFEHKLIPLEHKRGSERVIISRRHVLHEVESFRFEAPRYHSGQPLDVLYTGAIGNEG
jgi:hypothetical protein